MAAGVIQDLFILLGQHGRVRDAREGPHATNSNGPLAAGGRMTQAAFKRTIADFDAFSAFEALLEGVLVTDADLEAPGPRIVYANPSFMRMTGWTLPELIGNTPRILQGPGTDRAIFADMRAALTEGRRWQGRAVNYRKDGSEYVVEWSIAPIRGPGGKIVNYVAVQRNVSDYVKIEEDLGAALAARHEADQTKLDFLAIMSHELRTPLNVIIGFSEVLQAKFGQSSADKQAAEYVDLIHDSGQKLLGMVTDILDFARSPNRGDSRVFSELDLGDVIRRCLDFAESAASAKSIGIVAGDMSGMTMCAYEPSLRKIFLNILDNAIKFSPPGGRITVVRATSGDENHVVIADQGPGIPPVYLDKLFSPFAQAESSHNRVHEGLGLGLAIAQRMAQFHGGRIEIDSVPERGTCVHIFLPRCKPEAGCDLSG